jgi:pimeloyl-ACP methyl ester carboxylesterase
MIIDGRRLETQWWGKRPDAAPTLVLLHEGLGCVAGWRDTPVALAEATGLGVFAYSRLGYGTSDPATLPRPLDYMRIEAREVLPRVLDAAGIGRCLLVGHSDGASIAAIHAGSVQDFRVRGIVLIAPHFFVEDFSVAAIAAARDAYERGDLRRRLARYHDHVDNAFRGWNDVWLDPGFRDSFDLTADLAHIRVPMLIVQGADDQYGTVAQIEMARRETTCPCDAVLIAGAKHAPHLETPDPARAAIADFAARIFTVHEPAKVIRPPAL